MHRHDYLRRLALLVIAALSCAAGAARAETAHATQIQIYLHELIEQLGPHVSDSLQRIDSLPRQLLAGRSYMRSSERLQSRWSWTQEEIEQFAHSQERRQLLAEIDKVKAEFARQNPGYSLYTNTQVRSLDVQLERWNTNRGVGRAAEELSRAVQRHFATSHYPAIPQADALQQFAAFLASWFPTQPAPLAAPGLSLHGQARAIDFLVSDGTRIVAGADTGQVARTWDGQGWTIRLAQAVHDSGASFDGPLLAPREPWHYEYRRPITTASLDGERGATP